MWTDNGWIQTARYDDPPDEDEPWHREYFRDRDNHRNDPTPTTIESPEEDDMKDKYCWTRRNDGVIVNAIYNTVSGYWQVFESNDGAYNTAKAQGHDLAGPTFEVSASDFASIEAACKAVREGKA